MSYHKRQSLIPFKCVACGKEKLVYPTSTPKKYCNSGCGAAFRGDGLCSPFRGVATGTVGAIGELRVAADLMAKGYNVFRALSPNCPCDLAILKDGKLIRVEVRTGYRAKYGQVYCNFSEKDIGRHDVLALSIPDGVIYHPPEPFTGPPPTKESIKALRLDLNERYPEEYTP